MAYPGVLQLFNNEIYSVCISIQKLLIKVATYEIYGIKLGARTPNLGRSWSSGSPLTTSMIMARVESQHWVAKLFS